MEKKHVYEAIAEVAAILTKEGISKDRKNTQQNFSFRSIDDIYNALAPAMVKAQLVIIPKVTSRSLREVTTAKGTVLYYVVVEAEYDFVSAKDGSQHTAKVIGEAMDSGDKATNKAMSAAYKYLCIQTFCIPTEGDNDADATTHHPIVNHRAVETKQDGPTKGEKQDLLKLAESSTLDTAKKAEAIKAVMDCHDYATYNKLLHRLEDLQPSIDQIQNPSAKDINRHLKTVQS